MSDSFGLRRCPTPHETGWYFDTERRGGVHPVNRADLKTPSVGRGFLDTRDCQVMSLIFALVVAAASPCEVPSSEEAAQRSLPYAAFDGRNGPFGWRTLAAGGCTDSVVSLLARYSETNRSRLAPAQRREIAFHIGQALAMAGREQEAIAPLEQALDTEAPEEWSTYVRATLAFLRRDGPALQAARASYAALAPGSVRLRIIDGLVACPAEPYMKAAHCKT